MWKIRGRRGNIRPLRPGRTAKVQSYGNRAKGAKGAGGNNLPISVAVAWMKRSGIRGVGSPRFAHGPWNADPFPLRRALSPLPSMKLTYQWEELPNRAPREPCRMNDLLALSQQCARVSEIRFINAFTEPVVCRCEHLAAQSAFIPTLPKAA